MNVDKVCDKIPHSLLKTKQMSPQGSPRMLACVAFPFSSGSSRLRNRTEVFCIAGGFFTNWATRESPKYKYSWPRWNRWEFSEYAISFKCGRNYTQWWTAKCFLLEIENYEKDDCSCHFWSPLYWNSYPVHWRKGERKVSQEKYTFVHRHMRVSGEKPERINKWSLKIS